MLCVVCRAEEKDVRNKGGVVVQPGWIVKRRWLEMAGQTKDVSRKYPSDQIKSASCIGHSRNRWDSRGSGVIKDGSRVEGAEGLYRLRVPRGVNIKGKQHTGLRGRPGGENSGLFVQFAATAVEGRRLVMDNGHMLSASTHTLAPGFV